MADENDNPVEAGQLLGEDGAFQENWRDVAFDEGDALRSDPTLGNIKDIRAMAKTVVASQKQIGQLSGGREFAILPNEQSTDKERNEYYTKIGRPDSPEGYLLNDIPVPEGQAKDEKFISAMGQILFKAGTPRTMATEIAKGYMEYFQGVLSAADTQEKLDAQEANKELRSKLGAAYDKTMRDITAMVNAFGSPIDANETAELIKELPNDSFAAQLLGKIAERFGEKGLAEMPAAATGEITPADAMAKFNELSADPYYMTASPKDKPKNQQYHDDLVRKGVALIALTKNKGQA